MMNYRLGRTPRVNGHAQQGSVLDCQFPDGSFDAVVAIGCYHHTGNLQRAIDETHRVLKPGRTAYIMVYNALSYRNWFRWPIRTARAALGRADTLSVDQRRAYDPNVAGEAAPETVFTTRGELKRMFGGFVAYEDRLENWGWGRLEKFGLPVRNLMLSSLSRAVGLDIYAKAQR